MAEGLSRELYQDLVGLVPLHPLEAARDDLYAGIEEQIEQYFGRRFFDHVKTQMTYRGELSEQHLQELADRYDRTARASIQMYNFLAEKNEGFLERWMQEAENESYAHVARDLVEEELGRADDLPEHTYFHAAQWLSQFFRYG